MQRKRDKQLNFRLNEVELNQFQNLVLKSNLKQSEYMRKCLLQKEIIVINDIKELTIQLKKIGNNLNQLTKSVHEGKVNCGNELVELQTELQCVWEEVIRALKKVNG